MGYLSCLCDGGEVSKVVAALLAIVCWYVVSTSLVVYNKWLFSTCPTTTSDDENCHFYGFHYPITTTMFHMITNAIVCRLIALVLKISVPSVSEGFSWRIYLYYIVTLGAFTGGDIAMTNASFMFLAASYIEMIKSSVPFFVLLFSFIIRLTSPSILLFVSIASICGGLSWASYGEADFNVVGFILALLASVCCALRLIVAQLLFQNTGLEFSPIVTVSLIAPIIALALFPLAAFIEFPSLFSSKFVSDPWVLQTLGVVFVGAILAVMLNTVDLLVIKLTSALTATVAGNFKTVIVILVAWAIFKNEIRVQQIVGYSFVVFGVCVYNVQKFISRRQTPTSDQYSSSSATNSSFSILDEMDNDAWDADVALEDPRPYDTTDDVKIVEVELQLINGGFHDPSKAKSNKAGYSCVPIEE